MSHATATFAIKSWDEKPYDEAEGRPKMTRARVTQSFEGDIVGEGTIDYLMAYGEGGSATYVYQERVVGKIGGRNGSFVLQGTGKFADGAATGDFTIIPGSGTDSLKGIRGSGSFGASHGDESSQEMTLDYELDS